MTTTRDPNTKGDAITHDQAAEAVDAMDDCAKMDVSVDPIGMRTTLERYIAQQRAASLAAPPAQWEGVVRDALSRFRLQHWEDAEGRLGLADALSQLYGDDDIGRAREELDLLADHIADALESALARLAAKEGK